MGMKVGLTSGFVLSFAGLIYHHHVKLDNQEVRVDILESGGKVKRHKWNSSFWLAGFGSNILTVFTPGSTKPLRTTYHYNKPSDIPRRTLQSDWLRYSSFILWCWWSVWKRHLSKIMAAKASRFRDVMHRKSFEQLYYIRSSGKENDD